MAEPAETAESSESTEPTTPADASEPTAPADASEPTAPADASEASALEAELAAAEADVARLRADNAKLAEDFRKEPSDGSREILKRAAASLSAARDRVASAKTALEVLKRTGSQHGLLAEEGRVAGTIAVLIKAGASREDRTNAIDEMLAGPLADAATQLGAVLAAAPERFVRERPGRDSQGRTVLDVIGRVEGDTLVPAISRASKNLRQ